MFQVLGVGVHGVGQGLAAFLSHPTAGETEVTMKRNKELGARDKKTRNERYKRRDGKIVLLECLYLTFGIHQGLAEVADPDILQSVATHVQDFQGGDEFQKIPKHTTGILCQLTMAQSEKHKYTFEMLCNSLSRRKKMFMEKLMTGWKQSKYSLKLH